MNTHGAMPTYDLAYYEWLREGARRSAHAIVPLLFEYIRPQSVVDVGCGAGTWLSVFREFGVEDVCGVDGPYVETEQLEIPRERFFRHDLEKPLALDRSFDLVVSLEVAEHLSAASADLFVDILVRLGPVILFSAAVPFQGGEHHVNEQWPAYWARRFQAHGYQAIDCLRPRIWEHEAVEWWYAQNMILYVRTDCLDQWPALEAAARVSPPLPLALVHPENYMRAEWRRRALRAFNDLAACTPSEATIILVDEGKLDGDPVAGRTLVPFLERDGRYHGLPLDDDTAVRELERLRADGAAFLAFAWPAFWWLDHYQGLRGFVRSRFPCILENERLVVFDLRES